VIPLEVLYEDGDLMAVSKPAGVVAHPCYKHADGTLFDALVAYLDGTGFHPRLLQRLDKGTSGVMLISKTMAAHAAVVRAMARRGPGGVKKEYLAVVHGTPDPPEGEIALRLRRDPADSRRVVASESEGKESVTRYRVVAGPRRDSHLCLLVCEPQSGRMHQIRVHLSTRGWPIVGDPVYGAAAEPEATSIDRQALHAWRVSLSHPITGAPLVITAPIPDDLTALPLPWSRLSGSPD
jgi:23S rRNA pseudouridine1911/1915/1917 synthase